MQMGLEVEEKGKDRLPLTLRGTADLLPIEYATPVPSAQIKSAVLLAGLHAAGATTVVEAQATRDHTERMLRHFGAEVTVAERNGGARPSPSRAMPSSRAAASTCRATPAPRPS